MFKSDGMAPSPSSELDDVSEALADELVLEPGLELELEPEDIEAEFVVKGLVRLFPPVPVSRLRLVVPYSVCCETEALTLFEDIAEPDLYAQIHEESVSVKSIVPPDQLAQLSP